MVYFTTPRTFLESAENNALWLGLLRVLEYYSSSKLLE